MINVLEMLNDSYPGFEKCCYELNLRKWMAFITGGLVSFSALALLAGLDLVLLVSLSGN